MKRRLCQFHLESPQTMGNFPCSSENFHESNSLFSPTRPSKSTNSAHHQESTVTFFDLKKSNSSSEISSSSPSKGKDSDESILPSNKVESTQPRENRDINCMSSDNFESTCKQTFSCQSRPLLHDKDPIRNITETQRGKVNGGSQNMDSLYSKAPPTMNNNYSSGHLQNDVLSTSACMVDNATLQRAITMPCEVSSPTQKEWVPFYNAFINGPFPCGNSRWIPYAHSAHGMNFDGLARGQYVLAVHPSNMMQSQPTTNRPASRDENVFSPSNAAEVNAPTESENSKTGRFSTECNLYPHQNVNWNLLNQHQNLNWNQENQHQNVNWNQQNILMSTESRFSDPFIPLYSPQQLSSAPSALSSSERENNSVAKLENFMNSYILKTLSPNHSSKNHESSVMPAKRSHETSDHARTNIASSPLRMSVANTSYQDEDVKNDKNQRIFSRQRRGRNKWGSHSEWQGLDGRRKCIDGKKSRSSDQTESHLSTLQSPRSGVCGMPSRDQSPPPSVRTICGKRVTMIDLERKIFIIDLLKSEDCDIIRGMTDNYVRGVHDSQSGAVTWRTLYTYTKQDLPCGEVPGLTERFTNRIMVDVIKIIGEIYCQPKEALKLRPRSWKEPHLLLYQRIENKPIHTGVEMHYDGCDITWNCMLSKPTEYEGGGTYIRCLRKTVMLNQGQVLVHPGELYHKGIDITKGVRSLIVCFMDGFNPKMVDDSHARDDKPIYELNVRRYW